MRCGHARLHACRWPSMRRLRLAAAPPPSCVAVAQPAGGAVGCWRTASCTARCAHRLPGARRGVPAACLVPDARCLPGCRFTRRLSRGGCGTLAGSLHRRRLAPLPPPQSCQRGRRCAAAYEVLARWRILPLGGQPKGVAAGAKNHRLSSTLSLTAAPPCPVLSARACTHVCIMCTHARPRPWHDWLLWPLPSHRPSTSLAGCRPENPAKHTPHAASHMPHPTFYIP